MRDQSFQDTLTPLSKEENIIRDHLFTHIKRLAGEIGERNIWHFHNLEEAQNYIQNIFSQLGYAISEQSFEADHHIVKNIIAEKRGITHPQEIIIIGAHYDTVLGSPGADDNASGVAAILEMARLLKPLKLARTLRFIGFVNEEPPFFYTRKMGSFHYAREAREKQENIIAMLSIESIGYYSDQKGSQQYPFPFGLFYPNTANFISFVSNLASRALVRQVVALFRKHTPFPSEGAAVPSWIMGVGWSDQWSFWKQGYRALMVTDTALFRNPNYHRKSDTPDVINYSKTARVTSGLVEVVKDLTMPVIPAPPVILAKAGI